MVVETLHVVEVTPRQLVAGLLRMILPLSILLKPEQIAWNK